MINDRDVTDAMIADSLANSVYLTIQVVDASNDYVSKSANSLEGMTVTVSNGAEFQTGTTTANGMIYFNDLRKGKISCQVSGTDFTTVDIVANVTAAGYYSIQVPVLSTTTGLTTIKGKVQYETDLTNGAREAAAGVNVVLTADMGAFFSNISGIESISVSGFNVSATSGTDGSYQFAVPADANGDIVYTVAVPQFEASQTMLLNEKDGQILANGSKKQTVTARFGTDLSSKASDIPTVSGVYAVFSAPNYTQTAAVLQAVLYNINGVESVNVLTQGAGYAGGCYVYLNSNNAGSNFGSFQINTDNDGTGRINYLARNTYGKDYSSAPTVTLKAVWTDFLGEFNDWDNDGTIDYNEISVVDNGCYFASKEHVRVYVQSSSGSGASISVSSWDDNWGNLYASYDQEFLVAKGYGIKNSGNFNVTSGGSNYQTGDKVKISVLNTFTAATANANLTTGKVQSVNVLTTGDKYPAGQDFEVIFDAGNAKATAHADNNGRIFYVTVTDGGTGYSTAVPTAMVENTVEMTQHEVELNEQYGEVKFKSTLEAGEGYMTAPTVDFYSEVTGLIPANTVKYEVFANSSYQVHGFDILDGGQNILGNNISTAGGDAAPDVDALPGATIVKNIYLGTGFRDFSYGK